MVSALIITNFLPVPLLFVSRSLVVTEYIVLGNSTGYSLDEIYYYKLRCMISHVRSRGGVLV